MGESGTTLAEVLWKYSYAYTAAHDFSVSDQIMVDDYVLRMGPHTLRGRLDQYQPATRRQYRQFPTLGFTVHSLIWNGDRAALHFTEHGRSDRTRTFAAWQGISLYRWDGRSRLTECRVEQDYFSRRRQLDSAVAQPVQPPAADPWCAPATTVDPFAEAQVHEWLVSSAWLTDPSPRWDDGSGRVRLESPRTEILDLFSCGDHVAFHARAAGVVVGGPPELPAVGGTPGHLFATGIVDAYRGFSGVIVSDRYRLAGRLAVKKLSETGRSRSLP